MNKINRIITHAGQAHRDDFLSVCLALAYLARCGQKALPSVERRNPTAEDLQDPDVMVLDVGGELSVAKNNFDHHQLAPEEGECTLTLLNRLRGVGPRDLRLVPVGRTTGQQGTFCFVRSRGPKGSLAVGLLPD